MNNAYICDFVRTPFGRYGGALSSVRTDDLASEPIKALLNRHNTLDWSSLDDVILGSTNQAGEDNRNVARMALLLAGLPEEVTGITLNRLCASGMDAVLMAARQIKAGEGDLFIAGGVESMSRAPLVMPKADKAFSQRAEIYETSLGWRFINPKMAEMYGTDSMGETAENVVEEFNISREDQDAFALRSQQRAAAAIANGRFEKEICPLIIPQRKGDTIVVDTDEHPRPDTTLEALAKLRTPFRANGSVTAGNASGINDGAAALLIASEAAVAKHGLTPLVKISAGSSAGLAPRIMASARHRRPANCASGWALPSRISTCSNSTRPLPARCWLRPATWACLMMPTTSMPTVAPSPSAIRLALQVHVLPAPWPCRCRKPAPRKALLPCV